MKGIFVFLAATAILSSVCHADWRWDKSQASGPKSPMVEQRISSDSYCFDSGFVFSGFVSGYWPEDSNFGNSIGGGASLAYFFGHNLGFELSYAAHGSGVAEQVGTGNLVYRFPLGGECCATLAPYVFGGPGVVSSGNSEFLWNLGAGMDFRSEAWGCIGFFGDFSYNFVNGNLPDFTMFRAGVRFPF